jgi:hypothetical protein
MFQNHLLQLLMITAMEAPVRFEAELVRDEKVKVLRAIRPMTGGDFARDTLRGQYAAIAKEKGVPPTANTATFAASSCTSTTGAGRACRSICAVGQGDVVPHDADRDSVREPPHMLFRARFRERTRRQSAGDSDSAGRRHPASLSDEGARRRHEAADDRSRLSLSAANSPAPCPTPISGCCWTR